MIIYFDENFPKQLAEALDLLQQHRTKEGVEVKAIISEFGSIADEEWIPLVARNDGIVITQDIEIRRTRAQYELCKRYKLGMFFYKQPGSGDQFWAIVKKIVEQWEEIKSICERTDKPFAFRITPRKNKPERLAD